jgi:hypothetical protein
LQSGRPAITPGVFVASYRTRFDRKTEAGPMRMDMSHKYSAGQDVYYDSQFGKNASRGIYKIVRPLPIEGDKRLSYRIKSAAESFERIAEEYQLTRTD